MHNLLNAGHQKQKFYKDAMADCPICCSMKETWQHLFYCQHEDIIAIHILAVLHYKVAQWCKLPKDMPPCIPNNNVGEALCGPIDKQAEICWDNFLKSHVSLKWSHAQQTYCASFPTKKAFDQN
eukprot:12074698-Ditylum_brightwellii.AAC.1